MNTLSSLLPASVISLVRLMARYDTHRQRLLQQLPRHSVGAEIGVHEGDFAQDILRVVAPRKLHLVDPWKHHDTPEYKYSYHGGQKNGQADMDARYQRVRDRFAAEVDHQQVQIHRAYSQDVADQFTDQYFDWIYIDANHFYEFVKQDLELYYPKVKPGGYIGGDDYDIPGWWEGGVERAVDEFVARHQLELRLFGRGQFLIHIDP